jgi:hypothetical protein
MLTNLVKLLRVAVVVVVGLLAPAIAVAQTRSNSNTATTASRSETDTTRREPRGDPNAGLLWIGGAVLALIFLAWLAMRIGDVTSTSDKVPN